MAAFSATQIDADDPDVVGHSDLIFLMARLLPGDPVAFIAGENVGEEALAALRADPNPPIPGLHQGWRGMQGGVTIAPAGSFSKKEVAS